MKDVEDAYWIAGPETSAKIEASVERQKEFNAAYNSFSEKHGGLGGYGTDNWVTGWRFAKNPGEAWRRPKSSSDVWVPRRSTVAGKAVAKELDALRYDRDFGVSDVWKYPTHTRPGCETISGQWVITHHPDAEMPADCRRIKASEYWAMREAQGE